MHSRVSFLLRALPLTLLFAVFLVGADECTNPDPGPGPGACVVGGDTYANGASVPVDCNTCTCTDGELTQCTEAACNPNECVVAGMSYADGATGIPAPDGCNTCQCDAGVLSCTEIACTPGGGACVVDGVTYADGANDVPAPDGCNTCGCADGVVTGCTEIACPPSTTACSVYGVSYSDGWAPANDGCNSCSCEDGQITNGCTEASCATPTIASCEDVPAFEGEPASIDGARVVGDTLELDVSYSGGCAPHYFRLCYQPGFLESNPVQVEVRLDHDGQGDPCEALPSETRSFDLQPLRDAWRAGYQMEHGELILRVGDGVSYTF